MKIIKVKKNGITKEEFDEIVTFLKEDKMIIYPTDTIYGIGVNACSKKAVKKVFDFKGRKEGDLFSLMVDSVETIKKYAVVNKLEEQFLKKYLPGSVTVILKLKPSILAKKIFSNYIVNKNGAVGFRVIDKFKFLKRIIKKAGCPIISTSANRSGVGIIESNINFVRRQFKKNLGNIAATIDAGDLLNTQPSTVVDLSQTPYSILRRGVIEVNNEDL